MLKRTTIGSRHTASMHAISQEHPAFGPTCRLAKRWLSSQVVRSNTIRMQVVQVEKAVSM
jgi:hypothetical protein